MKIKSLLGPRGLRLFVTFIAVFGLLIAGCGNGNSGDPEPDPGPGPGGFTEISATEWCDGVTVGFNWGNSFDAGGAFDALALVSTMEVMWTKPAAKQEHFNALKEAGFNAVRLPVTWTKVADPANNYTIRTDWMARVKQVVDYAVNNDMYILLNTHHDEGIFRLGRATTETPRTFVQLTAEEEAETKKAFKRVWEQIADTFKDYNEKLMFEGLNEPKTSGLSSTWNGGTETERALLNELQQIFVDTVRASGGNNAKRVLLITPYAASRTTAALNGMVIPNDPGNTDKLAVSIHAYVPENFALNGTVTTWSATEDSSTKDIDGFITWAENKFVKNGYPVVLGEMAATNRDNDAARAAWAEFYVGFAKGKGMPCFWWDNGKLDAGGDNFGLLDRWEYTFSEQAMTVVNGLMKGAGKQ